MSKRVMPNVSPSATPAGPVEGRQADGLDALDEDGCEVGIDPRRAIVVDAGDGEEQVLIEDHRDGEMAFVPRMQHPMAMTYVAKRNFGKSMFLKAYIGSIARAHRLDMVIAFSKTAHMNDTFDFLPARYVFQGYSEEVMRAVFRQMGQKVMDLRKAATEDPTKDKRAPHLVIILDDVVGGTLPIGEDDVKRTATGRCSTLSEVYAMGRHFKTTVIVLSQTATVVLNPTIRNNNDYLMIGTNNEDAIEPLFKSTSGFANLKSFRKFAARATCNHTFIMYDNLDADQTGVRWYLVRAPDKADNFELSIDTAEGRARKRKREEEENESRERARRRLEAREREMSALAKAEMEQGQNVHTSDADRALARVASQIMAPVNFAAGMF